LATTGVNAVQKDAQKIVNVWTENPTFSMGDVILLTLKADMTALTAADDAVEAKRHELTALLNARDAQIAALHEVITRARSGIRSTFGPDSTQYEQAGGKRKSERKPSIRKPKTE
jgi:hypothetical protein